MVLFVMLIDSHHGTTKEVVKKLRTKIKISMAAS
jgi:hypothetical protein